MSTAMSASARMGLPTQMSEQTIATIKATAPAVAPKALDITKCFYGHMLTKHPELFAFFNRSNQARGLQPVVLANSVVAYASNIDNLGALAGFHGCPVDVIAYTHCGLQVQPEQYPIVHDNLMGAIGEILGDIVTKEIADAWSESVLFLAKILIDREQEVYEAAAARAGGWMGFQAFEVASIDNVTADTKTFTLKNTADNTTGIDFTPGQFLTLKVDPKGDGLTAPRHYTITSSPGDPFLKCTVKRVEGGEVSTFLHDSVKVGDKVDLSPPFGSFTPRESANRKVLISSGIGETPMVSFASAFGEQVALVAHVDASPEAHAMASSFTKFPTLFKYSSEGGRVEPEKLAEEVFGKVENAADQDFYVCGTPAFQATMGKALKAAGAKQVYSESFKGHSD